MLRKSLGLLIIIAAVAGGYYFFNLDRSPVLGIRTPEVSTVPEKPALDNQLFVDFNGTKYSISWVKVATEKLTLNSNLEDKKIAKDIAREQECKTLINGGFYGKDGKHIGLFETDKEEISPFQENRLFNGVLSVNAVGTPRITREAPRDPLKFALQTGPYLQENNAPAKVAESDNEGRRMVAAVTGANELIFITVFEVNSVFSGPTLADLVSIISKLETEKNLNIADAINLDGGSASAFYVEDASSAYDTTLSEATLIGSYFCERE